MQDAETRRRRKQGAVERDFGEFNPGGFGIPGIGGRGKPGTPAAKAAKNARRVGREFGGEGAAMGCR